VVIGFFKAFCQAAQKAALERTYGVPLYQDQLMELGLRVIPQD